MFFWILGAFEWMYTIIAIDVKSRVAFALIQSKISIKMKGSFDCQTRKKQTFVQ